MANESTAGGESLLARVEALGFASIGQSRQGRPLAARGPGAGAGALVLMAGIHGDEGSSVEAVLELLQGGLPAPGPGQPPLWVVPALNPDGLRVRRKNSAGDVDLNRNFPASNFSRTHKPGYDPGAAPLSEPESAAFADLIERVAPVAVIAVHAPFACINHDGPAARWAAAVAAACGWPAQADIGYSTPGSLGSWLGVDRQLAVLTIELPPGPYRDFREPAQRALRAALRGPAV
jgi:protein MpaA